MSEQEHFTIAPIVGISIHLVRLSVDQFVGYIFVDGIYDGWQTPPFPFPQCGDLAWHQHEWIDARLYTFDADIAAVVHAAGLEVRYVA